MLRLGGRRKRQPVQRRFRSGIQNSSIEQPAPEAGRVRESHDAQRIVGQEPPPMALLELDGSPDRVDALAVNGHG
jgi:hypothetical protein